MAIVAVLVFLLVVFFYLRKKYLGSSLAEFSSSSQRDRILQAERVLKSKGYRIVDERIAHEIVTYFGSQKSSTFAVVDFMVEKDGARYPVKVRSKWDPERISGAWIRRHLLPIWSLYDSQVLYVDPDRKVIDGVEFSMDYPARYFRRRFSMRILWLMGGIVIGWLLSQK